MSEKNRGEPVFTNIDEVLADRIVSRSKENAGIDDEESQTTDIDEPAQFPQDRPDRTLLLIKAIAIALAGAAVFFLLRSRRK
ncbi:MAG: hypothetical protein ACLFVQ_00430 [Chitinispirillaceae bacterium]